MSYFDPATVQDTEFEMIPSGWQRIMLDSAEGKDTKAGTGRYIAVTMHVVGGHHDGRRLFDNLNVKNPSEMAQKIGLSQLKKLLAACGHTEVVETEGELLALLRDRILYAEITTEKGSDGKTRNKVKRYAAELPTDAAVTATPGLDEIPF